MCYYFCTVQTRLTLKNKQWRIEINQSLHYTSVHWTFYEGRSVLFKVMLLCTLLRLNTECWQDWERTPACVVYLYPALISAYGHWPRMFWELWLCALNKIFEFEGIGIGVMESEHQQEQKKKQYTKKLISEY